MYFDKYMLKVQIVQDDLENIILPMLEDLTSGESFSMFSEVEQNLFKKYATLLKVDIGELR